MDDKVQFRKIEDYARWALSGQTLVYERINRIYRAWGHEGGK